MAEVMRPYYELHRIAQSGKPFNWEQIPAFPDGPDFHVTQNPFGTGFVFERNVIVPDIIANKTVQGRVQLHVIATGDARNLDSQALYLHTHLEWTPTVSGQHVSSTCYWIAHKDAWALSLSPHIIEWDNDDLMREIDDTSHWEMEEATGQIAQQVAEATRYRAEWKQTYPGYLGNIDSRANFLNGRHGIPYLLRRPSYHREAVTSFTGDEADLTYMLYPAELGEVKYDVFARLHTWVVAQPEVAALV